MSRRFDVTSEGIVTGQHDAARGQDEIELAGHDGFVIHAYLDDEDCCTQLVGDGNCPLRFHQPMKIRETADPGEWQLGTNPDNDGRPALSVHSVPFRPLRGNGRLNIS